MSFNSGWRGPNIVKDGIVLYLDPGSPNSYYGSGNTWKDIRVYNRPLTQAEIVTNYNALSSRYI
jgi:hypothetical protein